jgi:hypothetical protein
MLKCLQNHPRGLLWPWESYFLARAASRSAGSKRQVSRMLGRAASTMCSTVGSGTVTMVSSMVRVMAGWSGFHPPDGGNRPSASPTPLAAHTEIPLVIAQAQRWNTAGFSHWDLYYGKEFLTVWRLHWRTARCRPRRPDVPLYIFASRPTTRRRRTSARPWRQSLSTAAGPSWPPTLTSGSAGRRAGPAGRAWTNCCRTPPGRSSTSSWSGR